jgi:hypothetical protein
MRSLQLSVQQLQQNFKKAQVAATVQCTGNRRSEMKAVPAPGSSGAQIKGLDWDVGAISTAEWGGVLLRDVLLAAGGCVRYSIAAAVVHGAVAVTCMLWCHAAYADGSHCCQHPVLSLSSRPFACMPWSMFFEAVSL